MDRRTVRVYEDGATRWTSLRRPRAIESGHLAAFAEPLPSGSRVLDLGCGPGWYAAAFREAGLHAVALDVTRSMLAEARKRSSELPLVRADLAALPFARGTLDAAWASACYMHLPRAALPAALAQLHAVLRVDAPVWLTLVRLDAWSPTPAELHLGEGERRDEREPFAGRLFSAHSESRVRDLLGGGGFASIEVETDAQNAFWFWLRARRARTLPDFVTADLKLLVCGLNPSLYSAETGVPFGRAGNRFWPAARAAGLVDRDRDPWAALSAGIGFTDIVKRATAGASELDPREYREGVERVERLVRVHEPGATVFVGLEGWRRARDRNARPGWIESGFGGRPAYLMPSTSGRNAHATPDSLATQLREVADSRARSRGRATRARSPAPSGGVGGGARRR